MKSFLQSRPWVEFKSSQGWQIFQAGEVFILKKPLSLGLSFLYSPEVKFAAIKNLAKYLENIKKISEKNHTIFYRLEILDENTPKIGAKVIEKLKAAGFIKAFEEVQPEWRQIIDISQSEDEILSQMKSKGRYNIKVAQKHGVEVTSCPMERLNDGVEVFYQMQQAIVQRQKFSTREKNYFLALVKMLYENNFGQLLIARFKGIPVAAIIISFFQDIASYLYGASLREHRQLMAPYLLHFEAIKIAKEKGCRYYDLLAIAPQGEEINHKYENLTRFKEQFGGRKVHLIGSWDLIYRPFWYKVFKIAERFRRK